MTEPVRTRADVEREVRELERGVGITVGDTRTWAGDGFTPSANRDGVARPACPVCFNTGAAEGRTNHAEFLRGATAVLALMTTSGEAGSTMYNEVVEFIGAEALIRQARRDGAMRWSGLSVYTRSWRWRRRSGARKGGYARRNT